MRSAIYYPHTEIKSESLLKTALLLWDDVRAIAPWPDYQPSYKTDSAREAFELVGKMHYPSDAQKRKAHALVEDFATRGLPEAFMYRPSDPNVGDKDRYEIYPEKLLPETWKVLQDADLVGKNRLSNSDYAATGPTGLSLMSLIADCCAGKTFTRVTDRGDAYASLAGCFIDDGESTAQPQSTLLSRLDDLLHGFRGDDVQHELMTITLEVTDTTSIPFDNLLELRKAEHKTGGNAIRDLRHRLSDRIEAQATLLAGATSTEDTDEIKRQFRSDMQDDLASLKDALKLEASQVLGTKEIITSVLAAVSTAALIHAGAAIPMHEVVTATGGFVTLGGLFATKSKFARTRQKLLLEHPTAYLYEARGGLRL